MTDVIVKMEHLRQLKYCAKGIRKFFNRYELDYNDFLKNGIPGKQLLSACNNDAMAKAGVEVARGE